MKEVVSAEAETMNEVIEKKRTSEDRISNKERETQSQDTSPLEGSSEQEVRKRGSKRYLLALARSRQLIRNHRSVAVEQERDTSSSEHEIRKRGYLITNIEDIHRDNAQKTIGEVELAAIPMSNCFEDTQTTIKDAGNAGIEIQSQDMSPPSPLQGSSKQEICKRGSKRDLLARQVICNHRSVEQERETLLSNIEYIRSDNAQKTIREMEFAEIIREIEIVPISNCFEDIQTIVGSIQDAGIEKLSNSKNRVRVLRPTEEYCIHDIPKNPEQLMVYCVIRGRSYSFFFFFFFS